MLEYIQQINVQTANLPVFLKSFNLPQLSSHRSFDINLLHTSSDRHPAGSAFNEFYVPEEELEEVSENDIDNFEENNKTPIKTRTSRSSGNLSISKNKSGSQQQISLNYLSFPETENSVNFIKKIILFL